MNKALENYINSKIENLLLLSNPENDLFWIADHDSEFKRLWKLERANDNSCWRKINSNEDVVNLINRFDSQVRFVENNVPFGYAHIEDDYRMALAEYRAIQGLRKMAQFIDPSPTNPTAFKPLSEPEIDNLFLRMEDIIARMKKQNFRRAMQD